MAEFAVFIDTVLVEPVTDGQVHQLAEGLADAGASIAFSESRVSTTMTAMAANVLAAGEVASARWRAVMLEAGVWAGIDVAMEILTTDEQDRRLETPA
jgi:molybdenum cofactor biosynthesis enzyme MoaA